MMDKSDHRIISMIADVLKIDADQITNESKFIDDLGSDSLTLVELVMRIEEDYDTEIPDEEMDNLVSVQHVIDFINENC